MKAYACNEATKLALIACEDIGIAGAIDSIRKHASESVVKIYGEPQNGHDAFYTSPLIFYANGTFSSWFERHLNAEQKIRFLELSERPEQFVATVSAEGRNKLNVQFNLLMRRADTDKKAPLWVVIQFDGEDGRSYHLRANVLGRLNEEQIRNMRTLYVLSA